MTSSLYNVIEERYYISNCKKQKKMYSKIALLKKVSHNPSYIIKRTI